MWAFVQVEESEGWAGSSSGSGGAGGSGKSGSLKSGALRPLAASTPAKQGDTF